MLINLDYIKCDLETFEGVSISLKPLDVQSYQKLIKLVSSMGILSETDIDFSIENFSKPDLLKISKELIPKFSENLAGIQIQQDGEEREAVVEDLFNHSALLPLNLTILFKLFTLSQISADDVVETKK